MSELPRTFDVLSEHLYFKVCEVTRDDAEVITGMLLECNQGEIYKMLQNEEFLRHRINLSQQTLSRSKDKDDDLGEELYQRVQGIIDNGDPALVAKITGMLLELEAEVLQELMLSPPHLQTAVQRALLACCPSSISQLNCPSGHSEWHHPRTRRPDPVSNTPADMKPSHITEMNDSCGLASGGSLDKEEEEERRERFGEIVYQEAEKVCPAEAAKITGMILEQDVASLEKLTTNHQLLLECIRKAQTALQQCQV